MPPPMLDLMTSHMGDSLHSFVRVGHIQAVVKRPNITCDKKFVDPGQLNYPSFSVLFGKSRVVRYTRILTNVEAPKSSYEVAVEASSSVAVTVKPAKLFFKNVGDRLRYTVTFVSKKVVTGKDAFGSISWNSAQNQVRSPAAFTWPELF
ncbi:PREDICTED: subtilisin-like protease SBT1.8 [Ipomoea nil]|uniref:subtilisin-like protease SBT1.8 n=1 Tax=Ipomoea nil TaxID=35883 RepID=UPI0009011E07|nr:PREDICTED: subtilisin-like protease SBT1.8 [Ipomoea nil]